MIIKNLKRYLKIEYRENYSIFYHDSGNIDIFDIHIYDPICECELEHILKMPYHTLKEEWIGNIDFNGIELYCTVNYMKDKDSEFIYVLDGLGYDIKIDNNDLIEFKTFKRKLNKQKRKLKISNLIT